MGWKDKMAEWGGGEISFLSEDGETVTFIVVDDPVLLTGKFKGRVSERIGCPIITQEGFVLLIIGKRLARRLSRFESEFDDVAFVATRHGEHNDIDTTYELSRCRDTELVSRLFEWKRDSFDPSAIADAVEAAAAVVAG